MADTGWFIATILSLPKGTEPSTPLLELDVDELLMCPSVRVPTIDVLRAVLPFGEQVANNRWLLVPAGMEALARQSDEALGQTAETWMETWPGGTTFAV